MEQLVTMVFRKKGKKITPEQLINKVLSGSILSLLVQNLLQDLSHR